ncbi:PREDICTED: trihelix transcription factor GT-3b-like [Nicotiana attenuata]|uniref:Trihelix transcription factor gt-3b n=1 Tax=Nicotiana attenuata TaxID=49451 RepID=A0A314LGE6_NICAT|nr:PREDICTED: trihelix transcription factor GT-3b-like [Nicotiana attenuata]OIT40775.1 trihelix transcription factor gt-3b [Nicotiana attenuata]
MFGGGDNENLGPFPQRLMFPNLPLHLLPGASISTTTAAVAGDDEFPKRDERVPPWSNQETRDFIAIRGELEREFSSAKRSNWKNLWEMVAAKMKERGYRRSAEQCKSKWKNLVNSYKGKESSDPDNDGQFPYFDELHALFTASTNNLNQLQFESEAGSQQARKRPRRTIRDQSSEEVSEDAEGYAYESDEVKLAKSNVAPKKKIEKVKRPRANIAEKPSRQPSLGSTNNSGRTVENIQEMLKDFFQQQLRIEMQWRETMEKRAREREVFEQEWRSSMEKLERDRMMIEQAWREREEQRRMREESRAEKRDALLTRLLNKLIGENHP